MPVRRFAWPIAAITLLAACNAPADDSPGTANLEANAAEMANAAANEADNADVPLADRPPPEPLTSGKPLPGEWDPELMTVELAGDTITIHDAKHSWPLKLDESDYDFTRRGLAMFGTPVRSASVEECPAGKLDYLTYANGLELAFQNGKLAGYWVKEGAQGIATSGGVRAGSPRTALGNAPVQEASFGKLITVDGTIAILDDKETKVTDLYAGAACIFD